MGGAFFVIWGVALLAVVALGAILVLTLRQGAPAESLDAAGAAASGPLSDTLLFYYEEEGVGRTAQEGMIVRIPGMAWDREWQDDLLRLEVSTKEPAAVGGPAPVVVPTAWGEVHVLAAYTVSAYRMTEIGTDIAVERFAAPVDVFLTTQDGEGELRFGVNNEGTWMLAPSATLSPEMLEGIDIPAGKRWVAASVTRLREVCLVSFPAGRESAGGEPAGGQVDEA